MFVYNSWLENLLGRIRILCHADDRDVSFSYRPTLKHDYNHGLYCNRAEVRLQLQTRNKLKSLKVSKRTARALLWPASVCCN